MAGETVDASIVFLPRLTTLIGLTGSEFTTLPLDVSQYSGAQFQVWRGPMDTGSFTLYLEESLDGQTWVLGAGTPTAFSFTNEETKFFSYSFRLRWFRLRIAATGIVTCWAEGLLRGGGSGAWPSAAPAGPHATNSRAAAGGVASGGGWRLADRAGDSKADMVRPPELMEGLLAGEGGGPGSIEAFQLALAKAQGGKP